MNRPLRRVIHSGAYVVDDTEADMTGSVADVRSKILSSLVAQFGGQLKEGTMSSIVIKFS